MASTGTDITFVVPGQQQIAPATVASLGGATRGSVKVSIAVGTQRGAGDAVRVTARPGEDVVVLAIANGPTLVLHPEDARDLMRAQGAGATRSAAAVAAATGDGEVVVAAQLAWPGLEAESTRGATRGWMGQVLLGAFHLVTGLSTDSQVDLVAAAATGALDGRVDPGVYELSADALTSLKNSGRKRDAVPASADGGPLLILVHGTFVDTVSTFGKLWDQHPQVVRDLFAHYDNRVFALDHPTMGASPIANALTLVNAMPAGARLHLVTHSRGGLVAEVLARACGGKAPSADELAFFADAGYAAHRADLQALVSQAKAKGLRVERVVRVACPARGTLLASKRFDAYLSVLKWGLELASVPVVPELVDFLHQVALRRANPEELPGIEAMMPESAVVKWLNAAPDPLPGDLRVIAGDMQGDSIGSWVKTLLSDAFYWTDNDIVVQTRSMYGGAPRMEAASGPGATFLLDRGGKVTHFNYFSNDRTVQAIASALTDALPAEFAAIGPLSWAGQDASGTRGTRAARAVARSRGADGMQASDRPAVLVLPGILGSNLKLDGKRIWLGFRFVNGLKQLAWDPATAASIEPDGPIGSVYDELIERLADTHEVIPFAFDWRRPIEDEARRLAVEVDKALNARSGSHQSVRLIAHSMGGLVARTMALEKPDTWQRLMAREGSRLLMLGTPNGGSWAPMQTLSGDDTFGNALVAFGSLFDNGGTRKIMAAMPGFIQLQAALLDPALGLDQATAWQKLADDDMARLLERSVWHNEVAQRTIYEWGAPPQAVLDQAVALRRRLDVQAAALGTDAQKMLLVIGHADFTPAGITLGNDGLEYIDTPDDGDGRVTLASALLPGVKTWKVNAAHGKLPDVSDAFAGYIELLVTGQTRQLDTYEPASGGTRGTAASAVATIPAINAGTIRSRPSHGLLSSRPPSSESDVMDLPQGGDGQPRGKATALLVSVYNGDLKFIRQPLMLGHYRAMKLTGTEAVVDGLVARSMTRSLQAGLYPDAPGSHQIFGNLREDPDNVFDMARPLAAVVAGLGEEGKLRSVDLVYTVRQAVLAYAQRVAEKDTGATVFEMAATLIGSGGMGISAGSAAQSIAQGALEANLKLQESGWPQLSQLTFVELYLERAADAWRGLRLQEVSMPNRLKVVGKVHFGAGALQRSLDSSYRGAAYDFISALSVESKGGERLINYTLDTRRARTEVRAQHAQGTLLSELVAKASNDANRDRQIGRTLFNLLVPVEMDPFLSGTSEMLIELDDGTAGIPWELLDTNADAQASDKRPWAIRCKLLRKLRTAEFRVQVSDASADDSVLVIGEPKCDPRIFPRLPGARAEAEAVVTALNSAGAGLAANSVCSLISSETAEHDAQAIINALFERPYRVVHIAGHGFKGQKNGVAIGGVVLSGTATYLGADEVRAMRVVPELVFLNCCHLAGRDASTLLQPQTYDRPAFAANIAEELIRVGVRCVIAAGWAVEDGPAEKFATAFYAALLGGARFIEAVAAARSAAWRENVDGNTWAAYQCYGDPEWTWRRQGAATRSQAPSLADQYAAVASPVSLTLALETLATGCQYGSPVREALDRIRFLDTQFSALWGDMGAVAEAFGLAYANAKDTDSAIAWYRRATDAEDGRASFKAAEQLGNLLVRRGEKNLSNPAAARADIADGISKLENLAKLQSTIERASLLGSAYKRLTMIEWRAGTDGQAAGVALTAAVKHYALAESMARKAGARNLFYPAKNCIACELRNGFLVGTPAQVSEDRIREVRDLMRAAATEAPDFWSVVGQTELQMLEAVASGKLAASQAVLLSQLQEHKARVPATVWWDSVYSEARFTLEPYLGWTRSADEKSAANALLNALKAMAAG